MEKYLRHYAEPETAALADLPDQYRWANVMVIPACNENPGFLRPPPPCDGRSLMILVINETVSASQQVSMRNQELAATVETRFEQQWQSAPQLQGFGVKLLRDPGAPRDVLLVDRFSEGRQLPVKGGVGHARKIGADLAAVLMHQKRILSPWIHCTDADVQLPKTYFTCSDTVQDPGSGYAALVYPFQHGNEHNGADDNDVVLATQLYELSLRYYVAGMKYARSPYAFHTIGSTMAVSANHYAKVRGFPKRQAGEDFYLLNKLAKVGSVLELQKGPDCAPIQIESRRSDRVPFGTGAAVTKIAGLSDPVSEFRFYHPAVFELLQTWLRSWPEIWRSGSVDISLVISTQRSKHHDSPGQRQCLLAGLEKIGTGQALEHAFRQSSDLEQFTRQMHTWFDAFRTLKLIHALRDNHLSSVTYVSLEANQAYAQLLDLDVDLSAFHERLRDKLSLTGAGPQAEATTDV